MLTNKYLMDQLIAILKQIACEMAKSEAPSSHKDDIIELLTIKECLELVKGLRESSVRKWLKRGYIAYRRAGEGNNGKYYIVKSSLLNFLNENKDHNNS